MKDRTDILATIACENLWTLDGRAIALNALTWELPIPIFSEDRRQIGKLTKVSRVTQGRAPGSTGTIGDQHALIIAVGHLDDADDWQPSAACDVVDADDVTQTADGTIINHGQLAAVVLCETSAWGSVTRVTRADLPPART